uniref:Cap-specific mRNA (nucleoside-2'-O-)-methyltransferase 1 n=1 Tax=Albugo laibachii Nc14 TaxID=890382 RepID=F0W0Y1_9STRA|nr:PREDICTED: FtsJ methyltransferase domain containing 2like putative [Albugo laibachii Nc14]|eukprot:CCA14705.1 PREDICTED: FtsJ methyltransferase domain containing 2like putative [Albugo laibachii Nc14]
MPYTDWAIGSMGSRKTKKLCRSRRKKVAPRVRSGKGSTVVKSITRTANTEYNNLNDSILAAISIDCITAALPIDHSTHFHLDWNNLILSSAFQDVPNMTTSSRACDAAILSELNAAKASLTEAWTSNLQVYCNARSRANPYEKISNVHLFQNRAALKLAELDAQFSPKLSDPQLLPEENNVLFFADICAGPGGFTEYLYWQRKWRCKGWGFTLKGVCDFELEKFNPCIAADTFEIDYGVLDDGDIYAQENILSFQKRVLASTKGRGVALVTADGGFSTDGDWNRQEFLTKRLVLCECITALCVLRQGGTFVCKFFDTFQDFTIELIYIMTLVFEEVSITKPIQSRPANSERFLVCRGRTSVDTSKLIDYLFHVNQKLETLGFCAADSKPIGDLHRICEIKSTSFLVSMKQVVELICKRQIQALYDIHQYFQNEHLKPLCDQSLIRREALRAWNLPHDRSLAQHTFSSIPEELKSLLSDHVLDEISWLTSRDVDLPEDISKAACVICEPNPTFGVLISVQNQVLFMRKSVQVDGASLLYHEIANMVVPKGSVLFAEKIKGERYRIIDAHILCYEPLDQEDYQARVLSVQTLMTAVDACTSHLPEEPLHLHPFLSQEGAKLGIEKRAKDAFTLHIPIQPQSFLEALQTSRVSKVD